MFGQIGWSEILVVAFVGLVVLGPERLPHYAREAGKMIRQLRAMANSATSELRNELGPEFKGLDPRDLNPKAMLRRLVDDEPLITQKSPPVEHNLGWATPPADADPSAPAAQRPGYDDVT